MINIIYGNLYLQATMEGNGEFTDELYTRLSDDILFVFNLIDTGEESCPRSDIQGKKVVPDLKYRGRKLYQI